MKQKSINPKCFIALFFLLLGMFSHPFSTTGKELVVPILHFPPWIVIEQEQVTGINIEIIKEMASKLGVQIKYKKCPWKRCLAFMEKGKTDLMSSLVKKVVTFQILFHMLLK